MAAELHTCPRCGVPGFTAAGLKRHFRHDHPSPFPPALTMPKKPLKNVTATAIVPAGSAPLVLNRTEIAAGDHAQIGQQLTALYREAQDAEVAIIRFGAAFWFVENEIVSGTRAGNSPKRGPGSYGFESWLRDNAPEISFRTARRYRDLAEAISAKYRLGGAKETCELFDASPEQLPPDWQAKREKVRSFISDKSVRALQLELNLASAPAPRNVDPKTGKRIHYPTTKTKAELQAERLAVAKADTMDVFSNFYELGDKWMACEDGELIVAVEMFEKWVKKAKRWLKTPPMSRAKFEDVASPEDDESDAGEEAGEGGAE
ncbi:hypothetical protein OpiT1DRAFT_03996 [Opitutaceae bacterium TAV1]|nr:hypothetical protein OpiT1DRAFT_03996 [Opitutaceae bacterium TAV1]